MTDDAGVPDSDPRHLDPAADLADLVESGELELSREHATLSILHRRTSADTWAEPDGSGPGRGCILEDEREIGGETSTVRKATPALRAGSSLSRRQREIAKELRLYPGFQGDE